MGLDESCVEGPDATGHVGDGETYLRIGRQPINGFGLPYFYHQEYGGQALNAVAQHEKKDVHGWRRGVRRPRLRRNF